LFPVPVSHCGFFYPGIASHECSFHTSTGGGRIPALLPSFGHEVSRSSALPSFSIHPNETTSRGGSLFHITSLPAYLSPSLPPSLPPLIIGVCSFQSLGRRKKERERERETERKGHLEGMIGGRYLTVPSASLWILVDEEKEREGMDGWMDVRGEINILRASMRPFLFASNCLSLSLCVNAFMLRSIPLFLRPPSPPVYALQRSSRTCVSLGFYLPSWLHAQLAR